MHCLVLLVLLLTMTMIVRTARGARYSTFELSLAGLRISGERALLYLTDRSRAVYVPTRPGYSLLLSMTDPDRFLARLREIAPAP